MLNLVHVEQNMLIVYSYITTLNRNADSDTTYKVIYIARHGEGYHNMVSLFYKSMSS